MDIYKVKDDCLESIEKFPFLLEKDIQSLIEKNLDILFNLQFVKTEFTIGVFRLDTLCFDEESNSFVIIEYKKGSSYSVIDQGYSYLSVMLSNKAEFILEYNENMDKNLKRDEIDWSQSRVIFVSPAFNSYQKNSVNFRDVPFELWEIKRFKNNLVSLERYLPTSKESINNLESKDKSISKVSSEIFSYKEEDHTSKCGPECLSVWNELRERLVDLPDTRLDAKKQHINCKVNGSVVCYVNFRKHHLVVEFVRGNEKTDGTFSKGFFTLDDPKEVCDEKSYTYKDGVKGHTYSFKLEKSDQLDYAMLLIKQKYKSIL